MEVQKALRPGRVFEREVFGVTEEEYPVPREDYPKVLDFQSSMQLVILETWSRYSESLEQGLDLYDPTDPKTGKTELLFSAVKKHLPRRVEGRSTSRLHLYISVGRTSLDWYHGVDAFFWWEGVFITIDASLSRKTRDELKSEFLLNPSDLVSERLNSFGKQIAERMKKRRLFHKSHKKKTTPKSSFEEED